MNKFTTTLTVNFHCEAENQEDARLKAVKNLPDCFDLIDDDTKESEKEE